MPFSAVSGVVVSHFPQSKLCSLFFFPKRESRISAQLVKQGDAILSNNDQTKLAANNAKNWMQGERQMAADKAT